MVQRLAPTLIVNGAMPLPAEPDDHTAVCRESSTTRLPCSTKNGNFVTAFPVWPICYGLSGMACVTAYTVWPICYSLYGMACVKADPILCRVPCLRGRYGRLCYRRIAAAAIENEYSGARQNCTATPNHRGMDVDHWRQHVSAATTLWRLQPITANGRSHRSIGQWPQPSIHRRSTTKSLDANDH